MRFQARLNKRVDRIFVTYADCDIYDADETGLFFLLHLATTLASKDDERVGTETSKERMTVSVHANTDGSDKRKPPVVGKSHKPRVAILSLPATCAQNGKAWTMAERI